MTSSPLKSLRSTLKKAGRETALVTFPSGTRVLILPSGGRVLGLFAAGDEVNFLWTHAALNDPSTARDLFEQRGWPNPGGDRTWLAPEHEFFVHDMKRPWETYRPPPALDPGEYSFDTLNGVPRLRSRMKLMLHRAKSVANVEIVKLITACGNPLRRARSIGVSLTFAGYTTSLSLNAKAKTPIALWQLLQLPPNGEMFVRTSHRSPARVWFGDVRRGDFSATDDFVRYRMRDRSRTHKIGVRAAATVGRAGYVHARGARVFDLIVRNFFVDPSGDYLDPPFDDLTETGYAFQACNVSDASIGHFAEMEHHVPATAPSTGGADSRDVSQVWAFRGSRASITAAGRALLGKAFRV